MKKTASQVVLETLSGDGWWAPHELQLQLRLQGHYVSESACTARVRELKGPKFGGHCVTKRRRRDTTYYEYRVLLPAEQVKAA